MRTWFNVVLSAIFVLGFSQISQASPTEHKGSGSGYEKAGSHAEEMVDETKMAVMGAIKADIMSKSAESGTYDLVDDHTGETRNLEFVDFHKSVGEKEGKKFMCVDFKDVNSGEILDVDFYVSDSEDGMSVSDARIHKVNKMEKDSGSGHDQKGSDHGSGHEHKGSY